MDSDQITIVFEDWLSRAEHVTWRQVTNITERDKEFLRFLAEENPSSFKYKQYVIYPDAALNDIDNGYNLEIYYHYD